MRSARGDLNSGAFMGCDLAGRYGRYASRIPGEGREMERDRRIGQPITLLPHELASAATRGVRLLSADAMRKAFGSKL